MKNLYEILYKPEKFLELGKYINKHKNKKQNNIEKFDDITTPTPTPSPSEDDSSSLTDSPTAAQLLFMSLIFFIGFIIWAWALVAIINYWSILPGWAKVLGILGFFTGVGGPIMTLIVVYIVKSSADDTLTSSNEISVPRSRKSHRS
jgi:hypothetical protein